MHKSPSFIRYDQVTGVLNRSQWNILPCDEGHVLITAYANDGWAVTCKVALLELPEFLARCIADEEARFGPWSARFARVEQGALTPAHRPLSFIRALNTTPGTLADDLGCMLALTGLGALAYALLVLA
jgi:hypothetical protein